MTPALRRYAIGAGCAAGAMAVRLLVAPYLGTHVPYVTFYPAVAAAAVLGGLGAGVLTTLSCGVFAVLVVSPLLLKDPESQLGLALYLIVCGILILLAEMQRRAKVKLQCAEAAERGQRQRFEVTLSSIGDGVIATDAACRVTFLNQVAADLTGWNARDAIGQSLDAVFVIRNEQSGAVVPNPAERAIREGRIVGLANHTVLISKSGRRMLIDDSGAPIVDAAGKITGAVLVFRDVSEARAREAELEIRNRMIDLSHDAIIVMDPERRVQTWNRGAWELYGWTYEEARGQVIHSLLGTRSSIGAAGVDALLSAEGRWDGELVHGCKDGREIVCESSQMLLRDADGNVAGILEINRDLTARKRVEEELRAAAAAAEEGRRTMDAVLEYLPEGLTIADAPDGRIRSVSRFGLELAGRTHEQVLGSAATDHPAAWGVYHPDGKTPARPEELPLARAVVRGEVSTDEEWILRRPDGQSICVLCNAGPIRDAAGRITGGLIAWRDVSHRKQLDEKLREAAKLESLGVLAGGIAHDFNNLLTGVLGNASLLLDDLPEGVAERSYALDIANAAERAAALTGQILAYAGRGRFVIEPVDLSAYIRQTTPLIRSSISKNVELVLDLARDLPVVEADVAQVQQLVMNLVINAAEAIGPGGGRVVVSTRAYELDATARAELFTEEHIRPGQYVVLEITDNGCGMDAETVSRMFDPFFTTKFMGRGLGLAAVQGIVRSHEGAIRVTSAPGQGTTFRTFLPAGKPASAPALAPPAPVEAAAAAGTVLLVDDEEIIRSTASAALHRLGYDVVLASTGEEALERFRERTGEFSLVLLDMTMPGLSGEETLRELRNIDASVPVILSSGFSEAEALQRFGGFDLAGFLQKPYTAQALARRVRTATAAAAGEG